MGLVIAFGSGIGNIGGGARLPMASQVEAANEALNRLTGGGVRIVTWYGHTGNFVINTRPAAAASLQADVRAALAVPCRILSVEHLQDYVAWLGEIGSPISADGGRWTPGLAFLVEGNPSTDRKAMVDGVRFERYAHDVMGVWKRSAEGSLESGGWGAVSRSLNEQLGGTWTARSVRSVLGVLRRATLHG